MTSQGIKTKNVAALITGAAMLGAGLGVLFSPQSGEESRKHVKRMAKKTGLQAARFGQDLRSNLDKAVEYGRTLLPKKANTSAVEAA